jgi:hypothetical protein
MKPEMRDVLARQSFEDKIRKVSELIQLSRKMKAQRARENGRNYPQSGSRYPQSIAATSPKDSKK